MKLTVLVDNNTYIDMYYLGEPALSFFIEDEGKRILFELIRTSSPMDTTSTVEACSISPKGTYSCRCCVILKLSPTGKTMMVL